MDKQYLLTYQDKDKCFGTFAWFDTEDEMFEFINENNINVIEALKINDAEELI
jgi:hypothetical protein